MKLSHLLNFFYFFFILFCSLIHFLINIFFVYFISYFFSGVRVCVFHLKIMTIIIIILRDSYQLHGTTLTNNNKNNFNEQVDNFLTLRCLSFHFLQKTFHLLQLVFSNYHPSTEKIEEA